MIHLFQITLILTEGGRWLRLRNLNQCVSNILFVLQDTSNMHLICHLADTLERRKGNMRSM